MFDLNSVLLRFGVHAQEGLSMNKAELKTVFVSAAWPAGGDRNTRPPRFWNRIISLYSEGTWSVLEFLIRSGFKPVSTFFIPQIWMILLFVQGLKIYRCCCKSPSCGFILADCLALVSNSVTGLLTCLLQLTCATGRSTNTCRSSSYRWWCATSTWWSRLLLNPSTAASSRRSGSLSSKLRPSASIYDMSNDLFVF